ncbi:DUF6314 family protein [Marinomonas pollencensis]|uniref:DUF6314 domain-containing protein n=1 Tax=Marinomonas pollencensis TaxID=491954 RepID=A0A3E0DIC1_9GAMM|nr:DUF6314 family protein [Marinomonas pollencensis]REG82434.1 hypothetical protein DFP81_10993 [Marinomonas pollencensis]
MYAISAKEVLSYFLGDWKVERTISGFGDVSGEAHFHRHADNEQWLDFQEAMVLPGSEAHKPNAFRRYTYRMTEAGFDIYFSDGATDGALFLSFAFTQASLLTSHHLCIKDHYNAKFEFLSEQEFVLSFTVEGPKKDYSIHTRFIKQLG